MTIFPESNPFKTALHVVLSWIQLWGRRVYHSSAWRRPQPEPEALRHISLKPVDVEQARPRSPPQAFDEAVLSWMRLWHRRMAHSSLEVVLDMGKGAPVWMESPLNLPDADKLEPYRAQLDCEVCAELYGTSGGPRSKPLKFRNSIRKSFIARRSLYKARRKSALTPRLETATYGKYSGGMF